MMVTGQGACATLFGALALPFAVITVVARVWFVGRIHASERRIRVCEGVRRGNVRANVISDMSISPGA